MPGIPGFPELPGASRERAASPGIKKFGGSRFGSPHNGSSCRLRLEGNPGTELYLSHQAVGLQAGDQPAATGAINATVGIAIDGMIEHIEEFQL